MIGLIREKMQGVFATVIVGFISVIFALWGVESLFNRGANSNQAVLTVNGVDISEAQISREVSNLRERYAQMFGGKIDAAMLSDKMLRAPAIEALTSRTLLEKQVTSMNMVAANSAIDREIVKTPAFSKDGKMFDAEYFKERLRSAGMTPAMYRASLNDALVMQQLQQGIVETGFVTDKQVSADYAIANQTRSLEYVRLPLQTAIDTIKPDDKAVEAYFTAHASEFMTEEKVSIEYLELNKANLAKQETLSDDEVRAGYDKEAAAFKPQVERHAAHILIEEKSDGSDKAKVEAAVKKLKAGESFASVAKAYSDDKESAVEGGDVGVSAGNVFEPEFEQALAALAKPGDVSEPIKTRYGYHIIKLLDKKETAFPSFAERKADLEKQLRQAKAATDYAEKLNQMTESTYSAGDLAGPAAELKMDVQKTAPFGRRGGAGVAAQQKVIDAAFSQDLLDSGRNSQVIELTADRAVVIRVLDHQLPKQRELAEVRADIVERIRKEQAGDVLKSKANAIRDRLQKGESLAAIAAAEGLKAVKLEQQKNAPGGADAELVAAAFKLNRPGVDSVSAEANALANGDWVVVHLLAIQDAQIDKNAADYQEAGQRLNAEVGSADLVMYEQALRQAAKIEQKKAAATPEEAQQ